MSKIVYEEDEEDIEFPPVKFSPDLISDDERNSYENSCLNKLPKFLQVKRNLIIFISAIVLIIIIIILIAVLASGRKKPEENNKNNETTLFEWKGGYIIAKLTNPGNTNKEIIIFNNENIDIKEEDFRIEYKKENQQMRNLDDDNGSVVVNIIGNKFKLNKETNDESFIFEIKFKEELNTMKEMFQNNNDLLSLDLSSLKTEKINSLQSAFLNCNNLQQINLTNFNSTNIKVMDSTFENCYSLKELDLSSFDTKSLSSMAKAFKNCSHLKNLNIINFALSNLNTSEAFDFFGEKIFIIINNDSKGFIATTNNIQIINSDVNCTENIKECITCNTNNKYMCDVCKVGYSKSEDSLECLFSITTTIPETIAGTTAKTTEEKIPETTKIYTTIPIIPIITTIIHTNNQNITNTTIPIDNSTNIPDNNQNITNTTIPIDNSTNIPDNNQNITNTTIPIDNSTNIPDNNQNITNTTIPIDNSTNILDNNQNITNATVPVDNSTNILDNNQNITNSTFPDENLTPTPNNNTNDNSSNNQKETL